MSIAIARKYLKKEKRNWNFVPFDKVQMVLPQPDPPVEIEEFRTAYEMARDRIYEQLRVPVTLADPIEPNWVWREQ